MNYCPVDGNSFELIIALLVEIVLNELLPC
jgi:hypothetical protein